MTDCCNPLSITNDAVYKHKHFLREPNLIKVCSLSNASNSGSRRRNADFCGHGRVCLDGNLTISKFDIIICRYAIPLQYDANCDGFRKPLIVVGNLLAWSR